MDTFGLLERPGLLNTLKTDEPDGARWPRGKTSDDAGMIYRRLAQR